MRTLAIDIETYGSNDLKSCGVYAYTEAADFEILLLAYSFDGGEVKLIDLASGDFQNDDLRMVRDALVDPSILKTAFNANFERTCLAKFFGMELPPEQWECTMVKAAMTGLPLSLEMVAKVLKLSQQKDAAGKALIKYFTMPCKPTNANGQRVRNMPYHDEVKWEAFCEYCKQDVRTELAILDRISREPMPAQEKRLWCLDQRINDTGVLLDADFVNQAIEISRQNTIRLEREAIELTGLDNPNSAAQLKQWLSAEIGTSVDSLTKTSIPELLKDTDCEIVTRVLNIRQEMAKTSVKKYDAMRSVVCADNRVRGLLQFYGANRTGRWAGRLVQVQNLPQNHLADLDLARQVVESGDADMLELLFGNIPDTLSQLIRTAFIAPSGSTFIVADFSAIEARVIAWLAGERWRLDVFNTHGKIYEASAAQMFKVPIETVTKGSDLRQKGKVAELACIAQGQLVLTDRGLIPIEEVELSHKVWDGIDFVRHEGVIYKGLKNVITYEGLTATEDHAVWIQGQPFPIQLGEAAASGAHLLLTGNGGQGIRMGGNNRTGETVEKGLGGSLCAHQVHWMPSGTMDQLLQHEEWQNKGLSSLLTTPQSTKVVGSKINRSKAKMHKSEGRKLPQLWGKRNRIQISYYSRSRALPSKKLWETLKGFRNRSNKQRWALRAGEYPIRYQSAESSKPKILPTYDILNAGPNNRFTVSNVLVHNCGYQGGVNALIQMGALKMGLLESSLPQIISAWRQANPAVVRLWKVVGDAALDAVATGKPVQIMHGIRFYVSGNVLFVELPSGRKLAYVSPRINPGRFGEVLTYEGMDQTTKQWKVIETYGGKLVENIVQAIARDCLAVAMLRLDDAGFKIVMSVHDEVVIEEKDEHVRLGEVNRIMSEPIPWAKGLPLTADSYETKYYKKD